MVQLKASWALRFRFPCGRLVHIAGPNSVQFLDEDRNGEVAGLDALHDAELQYFHDLLDGRSRLECTLDVPARARRVHVCVGNAMLRSSTSFGVKVPLP